MTMEDTYLERGWQAFLVGAGLTQHESDCEAGFKDRFRHEVEVQQAEHPKWLAQQAPAIEEKARQIGVKAAELAMLSGIITVANINRATYLVSQDGDTVLC